MTRDIRTVDDVLHMLDRLFTAETDRWTDGSCDWWDEFYANRSRDIPFFVDKPDENLASYLERGLITPGRALDLGCGPGRNAVFLAAQGYEVDAVDLSRTAVAWGQERAREAGVDVRFHCGDIFTVDLPPGRYDLIYDSGCLHHLPPHRRISYLALLERTLAPGGHFALACFASGATGSKLPDEEFYRTRSLDGGLAYTLDDLRGLFPAFTEIELRAMRRQSPDSPLFGVSLLNTGLFQRPL
ncbi:class I SAM-dependent methyltransferase [Streptomyces sp. NPDC085463]|uniref:class I SAM-dependent methyltransferase n=1 Tax=Streptomyces sp. NPDC085463 TaxID=3365724 RepID=UPI0037D5D922